MARHPWSALAVASLLGLISCSSSDANADTSITVFATASLTNVFTEIGEAFETENPGSTIELNFASSSDLATQIIEGAPADVFASADTVNLERVQKASVPVGDVRILATNSLEIIVESGNPKNIATLSDLSNPDLIYVTCDESVPIGRYSSDILNRANVTVNPRSFEENVKGIVNKIVLGEADAGIVYRTDVIAAGSTAQGVVIPDESNVVAEYLIATVRDFPSLVAQSFITFVTTSRTARDILERFGFTTS